MGADVGGGDLLAFPLRPLGLFDAVTGVNETVGRAGAEVGLAGCHRRGGTAPFPMALRLHMEGAFCAAAGTANSDDVLIEVEIGRIDCECGVVIKLIERSRVGARLPPSSRGVMQHRRWASLVLPNLRRRHGLRGGRYGMPVGGLRRFGVAM